MKRGPERPHGCGLVLGRRERSDSAEIELREQLALRRALVRALAEEVRGDRAVPPEPHFADAELAVDLELVDAAGGPDYFDREVGLLAAFERSDHVALVWLCGPFLRLATDRPRADAVQLEVHLLGIGLEQSADRRLDALVAS